MNRAELSALLKSKRGVNKNQLHRASGLTRTQIDSIESGKRNYTVDSLLLYMEHGGIDLMLLKAKARPKPGNA
jgi:transcriptional regulator with XRE-family HTH domain